MAARRALNILFCTFGSRGDVHPYIAVARELIARGHRATIATGDEHERTISAAGVGFRRVPPGRNDFEDFGALMREVMDPKRGGEFIFKELIMPFLPRTHAATLAAAQDADVIVGHPLGITAPMVAEQLGRPYAYSVLQTLPLLSACDPSVVPQLAWLRHLRAVPMVSRAVHRVLFNFADRRVGTWAEPARRFRRELGLPVGGRSPFLSGLWSERLNLVMCSRALAPPQSDWPAHTLVTGACLYDDPHAASAAEEVERFLGAGEPPVVVTLGSAAVEIGGDLFVPAVRAVLSLGRRALCLIGGNATPEGCDGVRALAAAYAPYSRVFPRAAAIIHQCGAGTTGEALRAGVPQVCVPFAHDQPDNAYRLERLGVARVVPRKRATERTLAAALRAVLPQGGAARAVDADHGMDERAERAPEWAVLARRARELAARERESNGPAIAAEAILQLAPQLGR